MDLQSWEKIFEEQIAGMTKGEDPAHDLLHFRRVVKVAKHLCQEENGKMEVVMPAAWLHDFVNVPKDSPLRSQASRMAAEKAIEYLRSVGYPEENFADIAHAIEAHSFTANIPARTIEAAIVQDADRLDGIGAIGVARCFATAGLLKRAFYSEEDPFCQERAPNERAFTVDHFYQKLFKLPELLKTKSGRVEGQRRVTEMKLFMEALRKEIER